jgi:hypothetical protein
LPFCDWWSAGSNDLGPILPANWIECVNVNPGEKISAIKAATAGLITTTDGSLWVTELT